MRFLGHGDGGECDPFPDTFFFFFISMVRVLLGHVGGECDPFPELIDKELSGDQGYLPHIAMRRGGRREVWNNCRIQKLAGEIYIRNLDTGVIAR